MPDKKTFGCFGYSLLLIVLFAGFGALIILGAREVISPIWAVPVAVVMIMIWVFASSGNAKKRQTEAPIIEIPAVLIEKIQEK